MTDVFVRCNQHVLMDDAKGGMRCSQRLVNSDVPKRLLMKQALDIERIVSAMTDAALDPSRWTSAMEVVASCTGSYGAVLLPAKGHLPYVFASDSMEQSFDLYIREGWINRDERYRGADVLIREGIITDRDIGTADHRKKSPFYREFLPSCGFSEFVGVRVGDRSNAWILSIQRRIGEEPFNEAELASLRYMSAQLTSVAETARTLSFVRAEAALDTFEFSSRAAVLLDRGGYVVRVNASAELLLGRDLQISNRRLVSISRSATATLDAAIKELLWTSSSPSAPPVVLPRNEHGPLVVYPMRLRGLSTSPLGAFHAILVIADTDAQFLPLASTLQSAFHLTAAEARLAAALANGADLTRLSQETGVAYETLRNQLKRIFQKTGMNRQAELAAMLARLLPGR